MQKSIVIVMVALCLASSAFGAGVEDFYPAPTSSELPAVVKTSSTTPPPPPPTTAPTTVAPNTTAKPTMPPVPPTTPPTTTVAPTTPSPKPTPEKPGNWSWSDPVTSQRCVMVQMAIKLSFYYETKANTSANATVMVPSDNANVTGNCGQMNSSVTQSIGVVTPIVNFTITFAREHGNFEISKMEFNVATDTLPESNGKPIQLVYANKTFVTPLDHSYYCTRPQLIQVNGLEARLANITVSHVQLEAFHTHPEFSFSAIRDCDAPETTDVIPIAVGIALAALVVVVLIAYLVARRRNQTRGYMIM